MKIKQSVLDRLDNNKGIALVIGTLDCSYNSAKKYIKTGDERLTQASMVKALREEFGLKDDEILEEEVKSQVA